MASPRTDRRDLLKKAAVGGAVVWTAPVVLSAAAGAGSLDPGCTFEPVVTLDGCGPPAWTGTLSWDAAACPGSTMQIDAFDGNPAPPGTCGPAGASSAPFTVLFALTSVWTLTLRDACDGNVLAGPANVLVDFASFCRQPGSAPGGPVPQADQGRTITITLGDRTIELPAGG